MIENQYKDTDLKNSELKVGLIGSRGYSGLETLRCLLRHPVVSEIFCFHNSKNVNILDYIPEQTSKVIHDLSMNDIASEVTKLDVVFMATPVEVSMEWAPYFLQRAVHVIDLSGAFRLQRGNAEQQIQKFHKWYKTEHLCPQYVEKATYGLSPWATFRLSDKPFEQDEGLLISNPGCYATSIQMALIPLLKSKIINPGNIVIDSKSGTSGAGRKANESLLFTEVDGECLPYKVGAHQHTPEISDQIFNYTQTEIEPLFTTHLLPVRRGIVSSIYLDFSSAIKSKSDSEKMDLVKASYEKAYSEYILVSHGDVDSKSYLLSLKRVVGSPRTQISYKVVGDKLCVFSVIDNLLKGAASQAVENLNLIYGWPLETGLVEMEGVL